MLEKKYDFWHGNENGNKSRYIGGEMRGKGVYLSLSATGWLTGAGVAARSSIVCVYESDDDGRWENVRKGLTKRSPDLDSASDDDVILSGDSAVFAKYAQLVRL